ncbi:MAG: hypothetical protein N2746_06130 [Deltaproteobacteria bacterium]|nr:hypothetical protein [Deltaproteobacteria bacterium]
MELPQNKREKLIILTLEVTNIIVALLLISFYKVITLKLILFFLLISTCLLFSSGKIGTHSFIKNLIVYSGILSFFLPFSFSLNLHQITVKHFIIFLLLVYPFILSLIFLKKIYKNYAIFSIIAICLLVLLILFVSFSPIKREFMIRIDVVTTIVESTFLLIMFFLIYIDIRLLEYLGYAYGSIIYNLKNFVLMYLIIIIAFSTYDIIMIKKMAMECINKDYVGCRVDVYSISERMYVKGLDRQNIEFLKGLVEHGIRNGSKETILVIERAEKIYPYECGFYDKKIEYFRRLGLNEKLDEFLNNLPAPARKACKTLNHDKKFN